jgi:protein transport protein SEC31
MKLKEIHRTSTFAWSPTTSLPLLATGSVAGALDESFSNESQLEIWAPNFLDKDEFDLGRDEQRGPQGLVTDSSRFVAITILRGCKANGDSSQVQPPRMGLRWRQ